MSNRVGKLFQHALMMGLALLLLAGSAVPAYAAGVGSVSVKVVEHTGKLSEMQNGKTYTIYLNPKTGETVQKSEYSVNTLSYSTMFLWPAKGEITKVSTSNKMILTVGNSYSSIMTEIFNVKQGGKTLCLTPYKKGKAKLTYTYGGKKHKVTVRVTKWVNKPARKVVVGGKACKPTNAKGYDYKYTAGNGKIGGKSIKVTPRKGWKVQGIVWTANNGKERTIKNGGKIPSKVDTVQIVMENAKTGGIENVELQSTSW